VEEDPEEVYKTCFDYNFEEVIRLMETDGMKLSQEIIRQVASLPIYGEVYRKACETLGVKKSAELAILAVELPLYLPMVKLKTLLVLIPGGDRRRYNHKLRDHIARFAVNLYINAKKNANISDKVIEIVNRLPKKQAISKLEVIILKTLRIAYLS
jgi:hypothetical protein